MTEKIERNEQIKKLRQSGMTYKEIGKHFGISRQCARQIQPSGRETNRKAGRNYRQGLRLSALEHYGMQCAKCGMEDIRYLTIDHINGGGKKHRKDVGGNSTGVYRWLKKNNYPEGFQTLCFACNIEKG